MYDTFRQTIHTLRPLSIFDLYQTSIPIIMLMYVPEEALSSGTRLQRAEARHQSQLQRDACAVCDAGVCEDALGCVPMQACDDHGPMTRV